MNKGDDACGDLRCRKGVGINTINLHLTVDN